MIVWLQAAFLGKEWTPSFADFSHASHASKPFQQLLATQLLADPKVPNHHTFRLGAALAVKRNLRITFTGFLIPQDAGPTHT